MNNTYLIPTSNVSSLTYAIAKLAKKAVKLGCEVPALTFGKTVQVVVGKNAFGENLYTQKIEVTVTGNAPVLNGWKFIGTVEAVEGSTVLRSIPGEAIPESYRNANPCNCDHCNINRRRNSTFIVQHESGEFKQVGRQCIADFLGHASPEQIVAYAQSLVEVDVADYEEQEEGYASVFKCSFKTESVVAAAVCAVRLFGYCKADSEMSTKDTVAQHLFATKEDSRLPVTESDAQQAVQAIVWMQQQTGSEFNLNLAAYARAEHVDSKSFGYLAAGAMMFLRAMDMIKQSENKRVGINDAPIGEVDEKIKVNCTVISARSFTRNAYGYYDSGVSQVLMLKTENNQLIKVFTTNMDIKEGDVVTVSGKIKEHVAETYEKSAFNGSMITSMAPRTRLVKI